MRAPLSLLALGLLLVQGCASLNFALDGHLSSISPNDISDIANNRAAYVQYEEQIKNRLSQILSGNIDEFFVEKFEVHGEDSFQSAIFKAHLSTSKTRADILNDVSATDDFRLFVLRETDELPSAPSMMTGNAAAVDNCSNGGIHLPNQTCVCPPFYSGDRCENMQCLHHGIVDGSACACPPGVYAVNCESRGCLPGVKDNMDISKQTFILVLNQKITMDYVLNTLVAKLPGLLADINNLSPNLIQNYIVVHYVVNSSPSNPFYYNQWAILSEPQMFIDYVAGINVMNGDKDQPTNQAIATAQSIAPQMRAFSNIFVFADTPDSEGVAPDNKYSNETVEMHTIMKTIAWRNRIVYILSQRTTAPLDTYGNYYDSFRRIAKATLGDVIVIDILEIDDVVDPLLYYYRQNENVAVRYGMTQDADIDVHSDAEQQWVYALLTVEPNGTVPTVTDKNEKVMETALNGKLWTLYRFYAGVSAPLHVAGGTQWNLRVFVESGNTAVVAFATDPMVDVGSASCMAELLPYTTMAQIGFTNTATLEMVDLQTGATTAPALSSQTRTQECTFPVQFQPRTTACTPGPFAQQIIFTNSGGEMGRRIVPGFCGVLDHHDPIPYSCLNNGTRTGAKSCDCSNTRFTGRNCGTPVCTNGGTVNKFPGNGNTLCICPFGYKGDFCEILSCDKMSTDNLDTFPRTFALVVQSSLSQATYSSSINTGITTMFNLLGQKDAFNDFVLTTFNTIQRNNTPNLVINTEKIPDADNFLSAITSDQLDYKASLATQQDAFKALLSTVRAVDYDKSAIFLFVDTPVTDTVEVNEVVLTAVEKQLEINIVITPPFNMPEKCMGPADAAIYTQITQKTGGNIINLCNPYDDSKNPIVQLFMGYGSTHHHVENLNEAMWMACQGSMAFFIDDPTTDSFIFINGELTEKFVASLKNLDDNSTSTLTTFIQTPFLSIYKIPTQLENQNGYLFSASPDPSSQAGVCTVRAVEKTSLTMSLGFTASPAIDLFKRTLYYASPANPVVHISSVFQDEPSVTIDVDDQYSDQYSAVGERRSSCLYEFFFPKTFRCAPIHDYFIVTVTAKAGNRTIQRAVRAYCYLEDDMCLNGGSKDDQNNCVCPPFYTGTYCETPICQNNITESNNYCDCGLEYSGRNCEFISCHEWDYLETQDVRLGYFKQVTFVLNVNKDQILTNIYLSNQMQQFIAEAFVADETPKLWTLITFDENQVTNVVSTSHSQQFLDTFNAVARGMVTPTIADSKSMAALYEAYKININPPEIIYLFTGSDPSTDNPTMQAIQRQRVGTQVNIFYTPYNVESPGQVPSPRGYLLTMQARQSGGRVIPMTPNAVSGSDQLLSSMITENALIMDDAAKDCSGGVTFPFPVEYSSTRAVVTVTGEGVTIPGNIVVMDGLGNSMDLSRSTLLSDTATGVYSFNTGIQQGMWNVTVTTTQGSCFVQVRAESALHVVPGFTSDRRMDYVESSPFSGYGSSRDVFMTFRVIDGNQYVSLTSVDIISSDFSQPWQSPKLLRTVGVHNRDPLGCAYQYVTDAWTMDTATYQKYILKGVDERFGIPFQRTFFYVMANAKDNATTCQFGTRNTYGECLCDGNHVGDFCTDRRCQNGGSPSFGICVCTDGYYGDFCEQYLPNSPTTDGPATDAPATGPTSSVLTTSAQSTSSIAPGQTTSTSGDQTTSTATGVQTTSAGVQTTSSAPADQTTSTLVQTTSTAIPTSPTSPPTTGSTTPSPCDPPTTKYDVVFFVDMSGTSGDSLSIETQIQIMTEVGQLVALGSTTPSLSRFVLLDVAILCDSMGNVTSPDAIAAVVEAEALIKAPLYPIPMLQLATGINEFVNDPNSEPFAPDEAPPVAVLFANKPPSETLTGMKPAVKNLEAQGYKALGIDVSAGTDPSIMDIFNGSVGADFSYSAKDVTATAKWIVSKMCALKPI